MLVYNFQILEIRKINDNNLKCGRTRAKLIKMILYEQEIIYIRYYNYSIL